MKYFMVTGSWLRVHGSWFMVHGSWFLVSGYWFMPLVIQSDSEESLSQNRSFTPLRFVQDDMESLACITNRESGETTEWFNVNSPECNSGARRVPPPENPEGVQ